MTADPKSYETALGFLHGLGDLSLIPNLGVDSKTLDLQRVVDLLTLMNNPNSSYPVIHIAGTKGKGSTAAMLASVLTAAGYRTGLYTSPYLFDFSEQIQIDGEAIPHEELVKQVEKIKPFVTQVKDITTFEALTALCFQYFKEQKVEFAVIEAGLGGRTDATNVVDPMISVITSLSYDHTGVLGKTIQEIASAKAGIIKPGKPVVLATQVYQESKETILNVAARLGSEVTLVEEEAVYSGLCHSLNGQSLSIKFKEDPLEWSGEYELPLMGQHQIENAATVLTVFRKLTKLGFSISKEQIEKGLREVLWPCRFEVVSHEPLIVLDGAHNVDSAVKLKQTINEYLPGYKIILVFGCSVDKDIKGMFDVLLPGCEKVIFTKSSHPRAADPAMLVKLVKRKAISCEVKENLGDAIEEAKNMADEKTAIVVTGSLFTAAAARQFILTPEDRNFDERRLEKTIR